MGGERFDRIGQLPQHPIPDRPHEPLLKGGRLAWSKNARELREPHRRVSLERRDRPVACWTPAQSHEGIEERLIRLAAAVLLDAVGPRHRDAVPLAQSGERFLQDGTLSDPGLAADQAELTGPPPRSIEGVDDLVDLALSTNDRRGCRESRSIRRSDRRLVHRSGDEAVATTVQRLDEPGIARLVPERPSDLLDARGERRIRDRGVLPHGREQLLLADDASRLAGEQRENGQGSGCQPDLALASLQALDGVQLVWAETDHRVANPHAEPWPASTRARPRTPPIKIP